MRFRFDDFLLDTVDETLHRAGQRIVLRTKSLQVLGVLVGRAERLVTRSELLDEVWPDAPIHEQGLSVCIKEIRAVLVDDPRQPRYIETAHGRGYRFRAAVTAEPVSDTATITHDERVVEITSAGLLCIWSSGRAHSVGVPLLDGAREIGRGPLGRWTLTDAAVSRRHARVTRVAKHWRVEDCGSRNGCFVDGQPLVRASAPALAGSLLRMGETLFVLLDDLRNECPARVVVERLLLSAPADSLRASVVEQAILTGG